MEGRYHSKLIDDGYAGDVIDDVVCDMKYISDEIIKALGVNLMNSTHGTEGGV